MNSTYRPSTLFKQIMYHVIPMHFFVYLLHLQYPLSFGNSILFDSTVRYQMLHWNLDVYLLDYYFWLCSSGQFPHSFPVCKCQALLLIERQAFSRIDLMAVSLYSCYASSTCGLSSSCSIFNVSRSLLSNWFYFTILILYYNYFHHFVQYKILIIIIKFSK